MPAARVSAFGWAFAASGGNARPHACLLHGMLLHAQHASAGTQGHAPVQGVLQPKLCVQAGTVRRQRGRRVIHGYLAAQWSSRH
jgi:hypothetical protein